MKVYIPRDAAALVLGADAVAAALVKPGIEIVRTGSRGLFWLEPMIEVEMPSGRIAYGAPDRVGVGEMTAPPE